MSYGIYSKKSENPYSKNQSPDDIYGKNIYEVSTAYTEEVYANPTERSYPTTSERWTNLYKNPWSKISSARKRSLWITIGVLTFLLILSVIVIVILAVLLASEDDTCTAGIV